MATKQVAKPRQKLKSQFARATSEWKGKTPDTVAPLQVQMRVLTRQGGACAITGVKFAPGDKKRLDHKTPIIDGGKNWESNLQWILEGAHKDKTAKEATVRKVVRKLAKTHAGVKSPPARPMQSRNDLAKKPEPKVKKLPFPSHMPTQLERLYGIKEPTRRKR